MNQKDEDVPKYPYPMDFPLSPENHIILRAWHERGVHSDFIILFFMISGDELIMCIIFLEYERFRAQWRAAFIPKGTRTEIMKNLDLGGVEEPGEDELIRRANFPDHNYVGYGKGNKRLGTEEFARWERILNHISEVNIESEGRISPLGKARLDWDIDITWTHVRDAKEFCLNCRICDYQGLWFYFLGARPYFY
jgi:hypothetical protein